MRVTSCHRSSKENIWKLILPLASCLLLLSACAGVSNKSAPKRFISKPKIERVEETGAKKEVIRPEPKPLMIASTPKARASVKVVEEGRREMAAGNFEVAEKQFQEAINIDPNNGIAYYYLARSEFELEKYEQASGILDKAEDLLAGSKEWLEAVATLRDMIKEKSQRPNHNDE
ncbi:MAG: hypothetical protein COV46_07460 [Deltaproteobacteria bacterium CG11_big_fil_rev_8_21_14_0_20_49_13]|nr:MAG: hypothetical protein COV46_07460 [Deltaproteobacteria bacterium CG11_big_fil_rev_8_21_14_0_20_49_13]